jgi:eukaryotic-like serine/threonine-protein kinase
MNGPIPSRDPDPREGPQVRGGDASPAETLPLSETTFRSSQSDDVSASESVELPATMHMAPTILESGATPVEQSAPEESDFALNQEAAGNSSQKDKRPYHGPVAVSMAPDSGARSTAGSRAFWTDSSLGPSAKAPAEIASDRKLVAGYEIVGELGRGGMGVVYKARQLGLNRTVALKMVLSGVHAGGEQLLRFAAEAQAVAHLDHPNIVRIYEVGEQEGIPFFSLEFVPGGTLANKLDSKPMPDRDAASILEVVSRAVDFAHQKGVVHRDLKPGNILLTDDGEPKIADFGLAKRIDVEGEGLQTQSGSIMGSPTYMAPEQAAGDNHLIGPATDVYALGSILYEMISGRPPFLSARVLDILQQVRSHDPVPPSRLQPKVAADLETICLKCLQKEPRKRYESAAALAADLRRFLEGEPILARPVSPFERAWIWCRRNRRIAALLGVVALLMILLAVGSTVAAVVIAHKQAETETQRVLAVSALGVATQKEAEAKAASRRADENARVATGNAKVAEEQSLLAVRTLYNLVRNIQIRIRDEGTQQQLRRDLLENALAGLAKVLDSGTNSSLITRTRIAAAQQMGDIERDFGHTEKALGHYKTSLGFIEAMAKENPDDEVVIWNRAVIDRKLGEVYFELRGDTALAREAFRQALEARRRLTTMTLTAYLRNEGPPPDLVRKVLGEDSIKLSEVALVCGDPVEAWDLLRASLPEVDGKSIETPAEYATAFQSGLPADRVSLAQVRKVAELAFHLGDAATCRSLLSAAAPLLKNPLEEAGLDIDLGDFAMRTGDPRSALETYEKAASIYDAIAKEDSGAALSTTNQSVISYRIGTARLALGDREAALRDYQRSLELRRGLAEGDPNNAFRQGSLLFALARCGERKEAITIAERLRERGPNDPSMQFSIACGLALCADIPDQSVGQSLEKQRKEDRETAIRSLERAVRFGYRDVVAIETDPDLAAIRSEPAFASLLERLRQSSGAGVTSPR